MWELSAKWRLLTIAYRLKCANFESLVRSTELSLSDSYQETDDYAVQEYTSYLLGKGGYVFGSVGLFVCLFVSNITQKVMNGLRWNFMEGSGVIKTTDKILVVIWIVLEE